MSERERRLQELGVPETVIRLAVDDHGEDMFFFRCQEPPPPAELRFPEGRPAEALWQCAGWVTAVRAGEGGLEYLGFEASDPEAWQVVAKSAEGLLANLFSDLVEDEDWDEEPEEARTGLEGAAEAVGFRHLDELLAFQERHADEEDYAEILAEWTRTL